jgi:hypothetical protein
MSRRRKPMTAKCLLKKRLACLCDEFCFVAYWLAKVGRKR